MRNKVFVVVREKRTFRIASLKNESAASSRPLSPSDPRLALVLYPTFLSPISSSALYVCIWSCECITVRACTSYTAIRLSFATKVTAGSRLATFYLVFSVASPFFYPRILFLFPVTNSYQFFVRLRLAKQGCRRNYLERKRKSSQLKVCRYFLNYPVVKTA